MQRFCNLNVEIKSDKLELWISYHHYFEARIYHISSKYIYLLNTYHSTSGYEICYRSFYTTVDIHEMIYEYCSVSMYLSEISQIRHIQIYSIPLVLLFVYDTKIGATGKGWCRRCSVGRRLCLPEYCPSRRQEVSWTWTWTRT